MHHEPNLHRVYELRVEHRNEIPVPPCYSQLTCSNSETRAQSGEVRKVAVRTKRKHGTRGRYAFPLQQLRVGLVTIITNQAVMAQILHSLRHLTPLQVTPMPIEPYVDSSDSFGDQRVLGRSDHPDSDVRITAQ